MSAATSITREQVGKVHTELLATARSIIETGEEHASLVFGFAPEEGGELAPAVMGMYPLTDESKQMLPTILHGLAAQLGLAVHVSEAWAVMRDRDQVKDLKDPLEGVRPSECDDRIEVLNMIFIGEGWKAHAMHKIVVVEGKRSVEDGALVFAGKETSFSGTLMGGSEQETRQ